MNLKELFFPTKEKIDFFIQNMGWFLLIYALLFYWLLSITLIVMGQCNIGLTGVGWLIFLGMELLCLWLLSCLIFFA
ncbi:MAG: hypothetical protein Q7R47_06280, partial [Candidatus Diapherotrites archaeon]|nr:hypothetical protein [Candidatus Diapherotrites archaeon]